jgi:NitT/TauT family transport system substrate-binding protein
MLLGAAMLACTLSTGASAESITIGHTINPAPAPVFIADQQGLFADAGLDVQLEVMTADPLFPAALMSDSITVAAMTPTTFLAAVANGLDLVAFSGTSTTLQTSRDIAIVSSTASGVTDAAGFAGRTVGVPGIGALLDVILKAWLDTHGVAPADVTFIEMPFPQMSDQLRAGRVDAVITVNQFAGPMIGEGFGHMVALPLAELPEGLHTVLLVGTRDWVEANPEVVATLRATMAQAQSVAETSPEAVREALATAMRLPPPVAERIELPNVDVALSVEDLTFWHDALREQGVLRGDIDLGPLVAQ